MKLLTIIPTKLFDSKRLVENIRELVKETFISSHLYDYYPKPT